MSWGNPQTTSEHLLTSLLRPAATIYGLGNKLAKWTYASGLRKTFRLPAPVISIGNLSCGGTGKTPVVIELARRLISQGIRVGILSRGYGRRSTASMTIVSNGQGQLAPIHESGDEPFMVAQAVREAVVIVNANRYEAGMKAITDFKCEVLLLDDGFQHYQLERDLDIVLIDYESDPLNDALLPAARLRESIAGLARATQVIISKVPEAFDRRKLNNLEFLVHRYSPLAEITMCRFVPKQITGFLDGKPKVFPISYLSGLRVITFCGLAQPENFASQVQKLKAEVVDCHMFADHHWYSPKEIDLLAGKLKEKGADFLVTTQKDLVKLQTSSFKHRILAIDLETDWLGEFPTKVQSLIARKFGTASQLVNSHKTSSPKGL